MSCAAFRTRGLRSSVADRSGRTLVARADARQVAYAFSFLGHCEDVAARLAAADIFVLPSRSEAFPNAVLEAMAAGLPIVASGVGGVGELLDEGRTGMLVPPDDPGAWPTASARSWQSPPLVHGSARRLAPTPRHTTRSTAW